MNAEIMSTLQEIAKDCNLTPTELAAAVEMLGKAEQSPSYQLELMATPGLGRLDAVIRRGLVALEMQRDEVAMLSEQKDEASRIEKLALENAAKAEDAGQLELAQAMRASIAGYRHGEY